MPCIRIHQSGPHTRHVVAATQLSVACNLAALNLRLFYFMLPFFRQGMIQALSQRSCQAFKAQFALRYLHPRGHTLHCLTYPNFLRHKILHHPSASFLSSAAATRVRLPLQISRASTAMAALEDLTYLCDPPLPNQTA